MLTTSKDLSADLSKNLSLAQEAIQDGDLVALMALMYRDLAVLAKVLFPLRFFRDFCPAHQELFKAMIDSTIKKLVVTAFRGFGKTSIIQLAYAARQILYQESSFILTIGSSQGKAVMQSENLKGELIYNELIKGFFGNVTPQSREASFSKELWQTMRQNEEGIVVPGTYILPIGANQGSRGFIIGNSRPDEIFADDICDETNKTDKAFSDTIDWFYGAVQNCVDQGKGGKYKVCYIGTPIDRRDVLTSLLSHPDWVKIHIPLCGTELKSYYPAYMDDGDLQKLASGYRNSKPAKWDVFCREFLLLAINPEDVKFSEDLFRYYDPAEIKLSDYEWIILDDSARTTKKDSADTAIIVVGLSYKENKILFHDVSFGQMHPDEHYNELFNLADRYNVRAIGVDVTGLHEYITYPMTNEMVRRGKVYEIIEINATGDKDERIVSSLLPLYRAGLVWHNKQISGPLEMQLLAGKMSDKKDIMDAFANIAKLLDKGDRYMEPSGLVDKIEEDILAKMDLDDAEPLDVEYLI